MATIEEVREQISALGQKSTFGTKKEVKHLPEVLRDGESIVGIISGYMNTNTWLITATDKRIIFLDKGMIYGLKQLDAPYNKISSVEFKTGLLLAEFKIWDGSSVPMHIKNVSKFEIQSFIDAVNDQLQARDKAQSKPVAPSNGVSAELEKLAELKAKGILTDQEFQTQKNKLLAS